VWIILPSAAVVGLEEQLAVVRDEEAIDFAMFTIRDVVGEFQDSVFLRA
jgi:hypothetical protein